MTMNAIDYEAALADTLVRLGAISTEMGRLEIEAAKLKQFFSATLNMLPDAKRSEFVTLFRQISESSAASESSLKRAIQHVLLDVYPNYLTAALVRDKLQTQGFDFSEYKSNPLASISTTLRRAKRTDIESTQIEGVTAYRLAEPYWRRIRKLARKL